ncbi:beta-crystallin B1 isoform X3 [Nerophis ophidion]|uniref:beta-crystallin B1 isoform X3 n=1 Tax=Nerophis ophidion TaxID=159077 RepID=UPI002ADFB531|nr:beta-crystallin B1 isoform X3 [Nerophis ophidion]
MSQIAKSASSLGSDPKDKGVPTPAASSKATKTGEPGAGSFRIMLFDQENFQGRMVELQSECVNICDRGLDRVRSLIVDSGPPTSVARCSSWRRESILAGTPGATPTAATASCRSGPSACLEHKICLHELSDFKGNKMEIQEDDVPTLWAHGFCDRVGSVKVPGGAWVGYQYPGYRGYQYLFESGDFRHYNDFSALQPQIQSVRRIRDMQFHQRGCFTFTSSSK